MIFRETKLKGAFIIEAERLEDERGFFARTWCQREFEARGLCPRFVQCSISFSTKAGTLRGMHLQAPPYEEAKVVRCTAGAVYDVLLDLRPGSPARLSWIEIELTAENRRMLYVPEGVAHGFQTLTDNTELFYQISVFHQPEVAQGFRWNDRAFGISWPLPVSVISERDASYPDFSEER